MGTADRAWRSGGTSVRPRSTRTRATGRPPDRKAAVRRPRGGDRQMHLARAGHQVRRLPRPFVEDFAMTGNGRAADPSFRLPWPWPRRRKNALHRFGRRSPPAYRPGWRLSPVPVVAAAAGAASGFAASSACAEIPDRSRKTTVAATNSFPAHVRSRNGYSTEVPLALGRTEKSHGETLREAGKMDVKLHYPPLSGDRQANADSGQENRKVRGLVHFLAKHAGHSAPRPVAKNMDLSLSHCDFAALPRLWLMMMVKVASAAPVPSPESQNS